MPGLVLVLNFVLTIGIVTLYVTSLSRKGEASGVSKGSSITSGISICAAATDSLATLRVGFFIFLYFFNTEAAALKTVFL